MKFEIHTLQTAPEASQPVLAEVEKAYGFIPNLLGVLAGSPLAVAAYPQLNQLIQTKSSLTPQEQQVALLAVSYENGCDYCMGAHCTIAAMSQTPTATVQSLRNGTVPEDAKAAALVKQMNDYMKTATTVDWDAINENRPAWNARWNKTVER